MLNTTKKAIAENPFYGKKNLFALYQNERALPKLIYDAYDECKNDSQLRKLFHIINFDKGNVNRSHNVFRKNKVDDGGKSDNESWINYLRFLLSNDINQFIKFLEYNSVLKCSLFFEYVSPREFMYYQIKTTKKSKKINRT